ncbi:MAG TPA: TonB-dependent receptor, partial [Chitinophagales bacterium]|nr:TonB-dependent receptor [Chitinophagales bacterium]
MVKYIGFLGLFFLSFNIMAHQFSVTGRVIDAKDNSPLIGVNILLTNIKDSTKSIGVSTDIDGKFTITPVDSGKYVLDVSYISYKTILKMISVNENIQLKDITLTEESKLLKEVVIQDKQIRVQQLGDTSQFNASAFKTNKDATTEDLLTKMPGVTSDNGTLKVNGEQVQKVLVDGKPFFGDDPRTTVQNLPADVIDKVQVFDKLSDQSAFTGFDDGNSQKTINIVTKKGMNNAKFGKAYIGYGGPNNRYNAGVNFSTFKGDRRVTLLAMSNNVNQQNFNIQDLLGATGQGTTVGSPGAGGRGGMMRSISNFLIGQQNGIATTTALGLNYADKWGKKKNVTVSGSYFFNGTKNVNTSTSVRNYIASNDSGLVYNQQSDVKNTNINNRFNFRIEYAIDSNNTLIFTPSFSTQNYISNSNLEATNTRFGERLESSTKNNQSANQFGINFSNDVLFQHKFYKKGRTISIDFTTAANTKNASSILQTFNSYTIDTLQVNDSIHQQSKIRTVGYTIGSNIVYTEPIKKYGQISISYAPSFTKTNSSKNTNNLDALTGLYTVPDTALTNGFDNFYLTNKIGFAYRFNNQKLNWSVGVNGQDALLQSNQLTPKTVFVQKNFISILPYVDLKYKISKTESLNFFYRTSTNSPTISQLQNVIDNSNSLILSAGNPSLSQSNSHSIGLRYNRANNSKATNLFLFANAVNTLDYIANSTTIFSRDTTVNGIFAASGTQYIQPVNLNGYWNVRTFITFGFPVSKLKSNMNVNGGMVYTRTPAWINNIRNNANAYSFNAGITLSSNISQKIDFTLS